MDLLIWIAISLVLYGIYKYITINNDYFQKRGIVHIKPTFLFGTMASFILNRESVYDFSNNIYRKFPRQKVIGLFDMRKPFFCVRDVDVLKQIGVKDFEYFEDHRSFVDEKADVMFGNSLISLKGSKWRDMRATLSPAFTGSKMRQMFELVVECASTFKATASNSGSIDCEMKDLFTKYTNDVISSTAFGYKVNSFEDPNNEFYLSGKKFMEFNTPLAGMKFLLMQILPRVAAALDINFTDSKVTKFFRSMVLGNMDSRAKQGLFRPDMINILMNVKKGTTNELNSVEETQTDGFATVEESVIGTKVVKRVWTDDELVAQCFLFFLAGFDTSSTLLSFLSYELTVNPQIQQKLYEEIQETYRNLNGKRLTYDALQKMKYLDACICETLRHWPPAALTDRMCNKDYDYDDGQISVKIKKGTYFFIPIYGFHHDEKYWPNPEVFDPERFSDENKDKINLGAYLPFGIGPRNCIGSRFALMEAKAVIFYLLLNFSFEPNDKTQIPLKLSKSPFSLTAEKGVHVQLKLRK
ncbi:putative cytochrome P450 9f2 [Pseudolycoriella hygida]|uniref:Cytochrome P450 9f2 n=1 Tax=Pseudolycoriella hygida TaxID=35572 RepID=A0A9Q0MZE1_9DIPT|nr:putative cytochrome P450 9f2 [Pseudolycoriella hygida]